MLRWIWFLLALALGGCSTLQVSSDFDPQADFSALHSYAWLPAEKIKTGDPDIKYDSLLEARIHNAVDAELQGKGYQLQSEAPDFLLAYHIAIDKKVSVTYLNDLYGYGPGSGWNYRHRRMYYGFPTTEAVAYEYDQGTLLIDVVRADNKQLIWRGSATDEVYLDSSPEVREKRLRHAVKEIFKQFPPEK